MLNIKKKGLLSLFLAMLTVFGVFSGTYRMTEVHAVEDYHLWRQNDPRWGSTPTGGSDIARTGCLVTSLAILAVHSGAESTDSFDPGVLANRISSVGGFDYSGGIASWAAITSALPDVKVVGYRYFQAYDQSGKAAEIKSVLDSGLYVICNVGGHWVFVEGVVGDDVYMIDPAKDDVLMFSAYNGQYITSYEVFTGKNPPPEFCPQSFV